MILDLKDLHTLACLILANKMQTSSLQLANILWVDFISMTVPLLDLLSTVVECADLGPFAVGLEDGLPRSETHGTTHVVLVKLGHGDNNAVGGSSVEFF